MLRVVTVDTQARETVLLLEGQILGPWIEALRQSCDHALTGNAGAVRVDLAGVTFVNREGAEYLRGLPMHRVRLVNASPLVAAQLDAGRTRWRT
jgi:hypothetical protein